MGLADLHLHTTHSWDGTATVGAVLKRAAERGLSVVAITDHDDIAGAFEAVELAPAYGLEVVPGVEVSTADGHLLALFVRHILPAGRSLTDTLRLIGEEGGLAVVAHPAAMGIHSLSPEAIYQARREIDTASILVGMETVNGCLLFGERSQPAARLLARRLGLASVGASDAHSVAQIGAAATRFAGYTAADLRLALESGATQAVARQVTAAPAIALDWVARYLLRRVGWVTCHPTSDAPLRFGYGAHRLSPSRQIG
jgi:predicted metal-dependent phosphoesterase TrpH